MFTKNVLILFIILASVSSASSQVNTAWPAAGVTANVGIGSSTPGAKLEVVAPGAVSDPTPMVPYK